MLSYGFSFEVELRTFWTTILCFFLIIKGFRTIVRHVFCWTFQSEFLGLINLMFLFD